jgi:hypothetical protein
LLPASIVSSGDRLDENQKEHEVAWSDLISKLRSLILASFDRRVGQYEDDIRQRDAQRHLPGWNFCTFFILKEGLARAFESVGLLEDALLGYDELAVGLDAAVRDLVSEEGGRLESTFLPYTEDLRRAVEAAQAAFDGVTPQDAENFGSGGQDSVSDDGKAELEVFMPLDDSRKPYRSLILSNHISLFDLRCYLFSRQMSLLLHQANAWSSRMELRYRMLAEQEQLGVGRRTSIPPRYASVRKLSANDGVEDLHLLAELGRRAIEVLPSIARTMRGDLDNAFKTMGSEVSSSNVPSITLFASSMSGSDSRCFQP